MDQGQVSIKLRLLCDMSVGVSYSGPAPLILRCDKEGKLIKSALKPFGVVMCAEHEQAWKQRPTTG